MATRKNIKARSFDKVRRERASVPWQYFVVGISCAVILAGGFFLVTKNHVSSVDYSMRNSDMRKSLEKLEDQNIKLKAERTTASSPAMIEKAGLKMGLSKFNSLNLRYIDPNGNVTVAVATPGANKSGANTNADKKTGADAKGKSSDTKSVAIKDAAPKNAPAKIEKRESVARSEKSSEMLRAPVRENTRTAIARK